MSCLKRVVAAVAASFALAAPAESRAQSPDSVAADSGRVVPYRLEGITVTVSRSRAELSRLPYAVAVLGKDQIQGLERTVTLDESLLMVPGVIIDNRHNFALGSRISIRGYGSRSQFGVRGIRIIQDGIPLTMADGQAQLTNLDLAAAGRIEVIRGPASSLYGNASGGVITIATEEPPLTPLQAELRATGGGFGDDRYYGKADLKASGRSGRFDYLGHIGHFGSDGFRLHSEAEYTLFNGRIRYRPDARSSLALVLNHVNTPKAQNPSSLTDSLARAKPDTVRDLVLSPVECPPNPAFGGCQDLGESSTQSQVGLSYRRLLGVGHDLEIAGYGLMRELDNPIPFTLIRLNRDAGGARVQYRHAPVRGALESFTTGFDLDHMVDDREEFARDQDGVGPIQIDQEERVTSIGLFANASLRPVEKLGLMVSGRYDRVRFAVDDRLVTAEDPDDTGSRVLDQVSPMVGLTYHHAPWLNGYINVGRGFQTPTTTEFTDSLGGFSEDLKPERSLQYEVGAKGSAAGRISYSLALFLADVEDQLIAFEPEGIDRTFFTNAGSSTHKGIEVELSALIARGLTLLTAYTYSDFRFDIFITDDGDFSDKRVPGIAPHRFHGELRYEHATGLAGILKLTAVDGFYVDNANENRNDGYTTVDLRVAYSGGSRLGFTPFIGIDNIFDVRYNSSVTINAFGSRFFEPAPGRNVYVGLRVRVR